MENSNFLIETGRGRVHPDLYEKLVKPEDLPFFLGLMGHLADRGINCPLPVRAHDGTVLRRLAGRPAPSLTFLEGVSYRRPTVAHCQGLGTTLAALHDAARGFTMSRENALSVAGWRRCWSRRVTVPMRWRRAGHRHPARTGLPRDPLAPHAGKRDHPCRSLPNNVLFVGDQLSGVIDFFSPRGMPLPMISRSA